MSEVTDALEEAAALIERRAGNDVYQKAWKIAARIVRDLKEQKLRERSKKLTDNGMQISAV